MTSTIDRSLPPLTPTYPPSKPSLDRESPQTRALISHLNLQPHIEGGYFVETDRDALRVPNPFSKPNLTLRITHTHFPPPNLPTNTPSKHPPLRHSLRRRLLLPRRQHHNPLPPHARLAARRFPPQPRPHSAHPAQRPGAVRDHPRGRSRAQRQAQRVRV